MSKKNKKRKNCPHCNKNYSVNYIRRHIKNKHPRKFKKKNRGPDIKYDPNKLLKRLNKYIESTDIPILKDFCIKNNITYRYFRKLATKKDGAGNYVNNKLFKAYKKCVSKKEVNLEKGMLHNNISVTGAKFSLKQLGWKERGEIKHSGGLSLTDLAKAAEESQEE